MKKIKIAKITNKIYKYDNYHKANYTGIAKILF